MLSEKRSGSNTLGARKEEGSPVTGDGFFPFFFLPSALARPRSSIMQGGHLENGEALRTISSLLRAIEATLTGDPAALPVLPTPAILRVRPGEESGDGVEPGWGGGK